MSRRRQRRSGLGRRFLLLGTPFLVVLLNGSAFAVAMQSIETEGAASARRSPSSPGATAVARSFRMGSEELAALTASADPAFPPLLSPSPLPPPPALAAAAPPAPPASPPPPLVEVPPVLAAPVPPVPAAPAPTGPVARKPPAPAPPVARRLAPPPAPSSETTEQRRGRAALADIRYPWQATGYEIVFLPGNSSFEALTISATRRIEVYVGSGDTHRELVFTLAHEIGHAVDLAFGTAYSHSEYRRIRGLDQYSEWFPCRRCSDFASPAGDFAETFAYWLLGPGSFRSRLAPAPSQDQLHELAPLFQPT